MFKPRNYTEPKPKPLPIEPMPIEGNNKGSYYPQLFAVVIVVVWVIIIITNINQGETTIVVPDDVVVVTNDSDKAEQCLELTKGKDDTPLYVIAPCP